MIRKRTLTTRLAGGGLALSVAAVMSITAVASPAQADVFDAFTGFYGYVSEGYSLFNKYLGDKQPSDLAQMQATVNQAKTQIIAEMDGITAAWNSSCAIDAVDTFQNINTLTTDNLQAFANSSKKCVTDAQQQLGAVTDKGAIDKIGFALNTVGPIALLANAASGFATDTVRQHIIDANRQLQTRLTPTCDASIDNPAALPSFGEGPVTGHGACYNYTVATPPRVAVGERGGVFYLPPGSGRAFLSWPLRGDAVPDDDLFPWRGYTVAFPGGVDFSIAISQVMQGTSWQIAGAALDQLQPPVGPAGSPVAMAMSTDTIYKPMTVFRTNENDNILRGVLNPYPDGSNPDFSGWHQMDGALRSVAAAANADGRVELFGISRIGNIFHRWQQVAADNSSWSPWAQMDGQLNSITVAHNQDGTLQVFGTDSAGNVWTRNQILGGDQVETVRPAHPVPGIDTWTGWKQMDGGLSQAAAVTDADGQIQLFGINSAGLLFHRQQTARNMADPSVSGAWTGWDQVQNPAPLRSIAATTDLGGRVNIFGISNDDQLFQRVKLGGGTDYTGWSQIPGSMHNVAAMKEGGGAGELVLTGLDVNGNIHRNTSYGILDFTPDGWMPDSWRGWVSLPNTLGGNPVVTSPGNQSTIVGGWASVALSASGGTLPYTWTVSGLPPGLSVDGSSVVGSPTTAGSYAVSAFAADATGEKSDAVSFGWTVTTISVPNVTGMMLSQAVGTLRAAGLGNPSQHNVVDHNCNEPAGTVIGQVPNAGTQEPVGFVAHLEVETWPTGRAVCN